MTPNQLGKRFGMESSIQSAYERNWKQMCNNKNQIGNLIRCRVLPKQKANQRKSRMLKIDHG